MIPVPREAAARRKEKRRKRRKEKKRKEEKKASAREIHILTMIPVAKAHFVRCFRCEKTPTARHSVFGWVSTWRAPGWARRTTACVSVSTAWLQDAPSDGCEHFAGFGLTFYSSSFSSSSSSLDLPAHIF
jgi:hypothetical protein